MINKLKSFDRYSLYIIFSSILYGTLGYFGIKLIQAGFSVKNMLFWRYFICSIFILPVIIFSKQVKNLQNYPLTIFIILGGLYTSSSIIFFKGCHILGTGLGTIIFYIYPAFVGLIKLLFFKNKLSRTYYYSFILILVGIVCIADFKELNFNLNGIYFELASAFLYAIYMIINERYIRQSDALSNTYLVTTFASLICLTLMIMEKDFFVPPVDSLTNLFGIAIIATAVPIYLLLKGMHKVDSTTASIFSVLEPAVMVIIGILCLNEKIILRQVIGIFILLASILIVKKE